MRIALVCGHGPRARLPLTDCGLHAARADQLAAALDRLGHQVELHRPPCDPPHRPASGPGPAGAVERETEQLADALEFGAGLGRAWSRRPPDVVHSLCRPAVLAAAVGLGPRRSPLVQTVEAVADPVTGPWHTTGWALTDYYLPPTGGWLAQGVVDGFVATSSQVVRDLHRAGVDPAAVRMVPWGVDAGLFARTDDGPPALAQGQPDGPAVLLSVAGLHELDGADLLVRALPAVPGARLVLGAGPDRHRLADDLDARRILALARDCGVTDRVTLLGAIAWSELPDVLAAADLVVWAGWRHPAGVLPTEPMAAGVPVLATAVSGATDTIAHGLTGMLVAPGRPESLAAGLRRLLAEPQRRRQYAVAAARATRARYRWEQSAAGMLEVYQAALSAGPADQARATARKPGTDQVGGLADPVRPGLGS